MRDMRGKCKDMLGTESKALCSLRKGEACPLHRKGPVLSRNQTSCPRCQQTQRRESQARPRALVSEILLDSRLEAENRIAGPESALCVCRPLRNSGGLHREGQQIQGSQGQSLEMTPETVP